MLCRKCGFELSPDAKFCEDCGASTKEAPPSKKSVVVDDTLVVVSDIGKVHHQNEDAGLVTRGENEDIILVVADGVSSSINPTSASETAVTVVRDSLLSNSNVSPAERVILAITEANARVLELPSVRRSNDIYGPEATIVVALVQNGVATIGWVGDSRAYVLGLDTQVLLTKDDSWAEEQISSGALTLEQAMADNRAHMVTQVLGMHDQEMVVHTVEYRIEPNQKLLLCSDGLWNYFMTLDALLDIVNSCPSTSALEICEHLVMQSNDRGGHDNITVALWVCE